MSTQRDVPTSQRLADVIEAMAGQPIVMCVDLVADRFITGIPKRISREAPVLILEFESERLTPGGGANAVANVASLGGRPLPLGVVGADEAGRSLLAELDDRGVGLEGVVEAQSFRTPTKTRILGGGSHGIKQQIVRYDIEDRLELDPSINTRWSQAIGNWTKLEPRVAVLSDYGYGAVTPPLVRRLKQALASPPVVLCDSRYRLADFSDIDGATPNEEEAEALAEETMGDDLSSVVRIGESLRRSLGTAFLLITRGSRGASLFQGESVAHIPVHGTDQVADVTGAGDTVIGTFALALAAGASPLEAALLASYAGGIVVQKLGTATVSPDELAHAVASDSAPLEELRWDRS
jgi:rfaE bifunctional protein kinase chain/domain